jgi:chromosome condensin MukBEF MukE localization factor
MNPLVISNLLTLADTEEAVDAIHARIGSSLQINKDLINKRRGAMHDAARLQMLVTWARHSSKRELHFHKSNTLDAVLTEACDYAPGIAVLRLAESVTVGNERVNRRVALDHASEKMRLTDAQQLNRILKGRTIDMTCVSGAEVQFLRPLFSARQPTAVKHKEGMHLLLQTLSDEIAKSDAESIPDDFLVACSIFASELFRNTQEHATRDHRGVPYQAHVEGLIISWTELEERLYLSDFQGNERLHQFWDEECVTAKSGTARVLRCLQLSFFDSGPGFSGRARGVPTEKLSRDTERAQLLTCLRKHETTKQTTGAGLGLPTVLANLQKIGGLMRIRSGRHSIFNVFRPGEERDLFDFSDWCRRELNDVSGALVTILVPLRRR